MLWCLLAAAPDLSQAAIGRQPLILVQNRAPRMTIQAGKTPAPIKELQLYLEKISGAAFNAVPATPAAEGIYVGCVADFPWLKLDAQLGPEGYLLKSDGPSLLLIGDEPLGVQHAVTSFLHSLGCRWFFPGPTWEIIPHRDTIAGTWNEISRPSFPVQRKIWYGYGAFPVGAQELRDWDRHNRMGGPVAVSIGHTWHGLDPKSDFAAHPEWFALVAGKRQPSKPCYAHPEVGKRAVHFALQQAAKGDSMISMTPPDGLGYCECDLCRAVMQGGQPYQAQGTTFARRPDGVLVSVASEILFHFVNQVAAAVAEKHPQKLIGCLAYSAYSHPPSFTLHPNIFVQVTTGFRRTTLTLEEQLNRLQSRGTQIGIRDYYSVYQWDWDFPDPGKVEPGILQKDLRFYSSRGVTSINAEASDNWAPRGLGYYVASRLMWDVNADLRGILRDFFDQAFGPAAEPMDRYYRRWYRSAAASANDPPLGLNELDDGRSSTKAGLDKAKLKSSILDLDQALTLAKDRPDCLARIDFFRLYIHYLCLRCRLEEAANLGREKEIIEAIQVETAFGGRLANANVIHARALLGKAFPRRFKYFESLLAKVPPTELQRWCQPGTIPSPSELEQLWAADKEFLAGCP